MENIKIIAKNRKARHDFFILETLEAGLALKGTEIKSIRAGQISIKEAYIRVDGEEAWLVNAHVAPYDPASRENHDPIREKKLLLHKREIENLYAEVRQKGTTIIPLQVHLRRGKAKIEIAVAKGKKKYDKREAIKKRDAQRDMDRSFK